MLKKKIAFIIGVTGQDGSYLSALLIKKKYKVFGFTRSLDKKNLLKLSRIQVLNKIKLVKYDLVFIPVSTDLIENVSLCMLSIKYIFSSSKVVLSSGITMALTLLNI